MDLGNLKVVISAETAALTAGLTAATAVVGRFAASTGKLGASAAGTKNLGNAMRELNVAGAGLTRTAANVGILGSSLKGMLTALPGILKFAAPVAAVAAALALTVGPAKEFETAFTGVLKTVEGTPKQLDEVRRGILDMSREIPAAATEIAAVAEVAGQLGIEVPNILEFTRVMIDLGESTVLSSTEAAQAIARFTNIMATSNQAADPERFQKLGSVIVELGNNTASTEDEITRFANRIAGAGAVVGLAEAEVLSIGAALASVGIFAEAGGTAVSRVFLEIDRAVDQSGPKLQNFADIADMSAEAFAQFYEEQGPAEAFIAVVEGLQRITDEGGSAVDALDGVGLSNVRVRDAMFRLASAGDLLRNTIALGNAEWIRNDALIVEAGRRYDTTQAKLDRLSNVFNVLAVNMGTPLLDALVWIVDGIRDVVIELDRLSPAASGVVDGVKEILSVLEPVGTLFGAIAKAGLEVTLNAIAGAFAIMAAALEGVGVGVDILGELVGLVGALGSGAIGIIQDFSTLFTGLASAFAGVAIPMATVYALITPMTIGFTGLGGSILYTAGMATAALAPWALLAAGLAGVGSAYLSAKSAAEEFRTENDALTMNDQGMTTLNGLITAAYDAKGAMDAAAEGTGGFLNATRGLIGVLPGVSNHTSDLRAEMFEATDAYNEHTAAMNRVKDSLDTVGESFELTAFQVERIALAAGIDPAGLLDDKTWNDTMNAIFAAVVAFKDADEAIQKTILDLTDGTASVADFEKELELSSSSLEFLAQTLEGVSFADVITSGDAEAITELVEAIALASLEYQIMGESVGFTADQMIQGQLAISNTIGAAGALSDSMALVEQAFAATSMQADNLSSATEAFTDVAISFGVGEASAREYLEAMRDLSLAYAASGVSAEEAIANQEDLLRQWLASADASGIAAAEAGELAVQYGLIPETILTQVSWDGQNAADANERYRIALEQIVAKVWIAEVMAETGDSFEKVADLLGYTELFAEGDYTAYLNADGTQAISVAIATQIALEAYATGEYTALLGIQDEGLRVGVARALELLGVEFDDETWEAILGTNNTQLESGVDDAFLRVNGFDGLEAQAELMARDASSPVVDEAFLRINGFDSAEGTANIAATDNATWVADGVERRLDELDDETVDIAARDLASGIISGVAAGLAGLKDKTVTVTTVTRGGTPRNAIADGGFAHEFGLEAFANGAIRERPGPAKIYTTASPGRLFAEPVTGGEAYIPLSPAKRSRSTAIWKETGRRLGQYADGGISEFQNGGVTTTFGDSASFTDLPSVVVNVAVDAQALGEVPVPLSPVVPWIKEIAAEMLAARDQAVALGEVVTREGRVLVEAFSPVPGVFETTVAATDQMLAAFEGAGTGISMAVSQIGQDILREMDMETFVRTMVDDFGWAEEAFRAHIEEMEYDVNGAMDAMVGSAHDLGHVWEGVFLGAADATDVFEAALFGVELAMGDLNGSANRALDGLDLLTGVTRDARSAQFDYLDAIDRVAEAIGEGEKFGIVSREARRNEEDLLRAGDAMREYAIETAKSGVSVTEALTTWDQMKTQFQELALQAGYSQEAVNEMLRELFMIPDSVVADIAVDGIQAREEIEAVEAGITALDGRTVVIGADPTIFNEIIEEVQAEIVAIQQAKIVARLELEIESFEENADRAKEDLAELENARIARIQADISDLKTKLFEAKQIVDDEIRKERVAIINADISALQEKLRLAKEARDEALADQELNVDGNIEALELELELAKAKLAELGETTTLPPVGADLEELLAAEERAKAILETLGASEAVPDVLVDDAQFTQAVQDAEDAIEELDGKKATTLVVNRIETTNTVTTKVNDTYTIQQGDSWWAMAAKLWGDPTRYLELAAKNNADPNKTIYPGQVIKFAAGGFVDAADAHQAMVASGSGPLRVWAEPETQGESYIPHANDWRRAGALRVLEQTAALMGRRVVGNAAGGFYGRQVAVGAPGDIVISAPINIEVNAAPGMDEDRVATIAGDKVQSALADAGRDLMNMR